MAEQPQIGALIAQARKEKGLTQKQLAVQLGVTDKAVSKWERNAGWPDVTLLAGLAAALDLTTGELLSGVRADRSAPPPPPEETAQTALRYAHQVSRRQWTDILRRVLLAVFTAACILSVGICAICDFSLHGRATWLIYPAASVLFAWLVLAPLLYFDGHRLLMALVSLTLFLPLFLLTLSLATGGGWFLSLGLPIALAALTWVWLVVLFHRGSAGGLLRTVGAALLLLLPLVLSIHLILRRALGVWTLGLWNGLTLTVCAAVGLVLFLRRRPAP